MLFWDVGGEGGEGDPSIKLSSRKKTNVCLESRGKHLRIYSSCFPPPPGDQESKVPYASSDSSYMTCKSKKFKTIAWEKLTMFFHTRCIFPHPRARPPTLHELGIPSFSDDMEFWVVGGFHDTNKKCLRSPTILHFTHFPNQPYAG